MAGSVSPADHVMIPMSCDGKSAVQTAATEGGEAFPPPPLGMEQAGGAGGDGGGGGKRAHESWAAGWVARLRMVDIFFRFAMVAFLVVSLSAMLTSTQHSTVQVLGFSIPVSMKWSRSQPFEFLVVVEALVCGYSFLQFIYQAMVFVKKRPPTRRRMWLQLGADQACTYLVLAAAATAAGASRMNRVGFQSLAVHNIHVPTVCTVLNKFCNRATLAIVFTLLAAGASVICAALNVYMLALTF